MEIVSYMTFFAPTISLEMWSLWPLIIEALGDWAIDFFESTVTYTHLRMLNYNIIHLYSNYICAYCFPHCRNKYSEASASFKCLMLVLFKNFIH